MRNARTIVALWSILLAGLAAGACLSTAPDPRVGLYGVEWARCAVDNDAAAEARACMRAVNRIYGQDGGVR